MSADQTDDADLCGECSNHPPVALPPEDPERRARLAALLSDRRLELDEDQAQRAVAALGANAEDRRWLREQYRMDDLLSRSLDPLRMDFPNRVLHARRRNNSERFVRRITATARARRRPRLRLVQNWLPVAIAAVIALGVVGMSSFALWSGSGAATAGAPEVIAGEVLNGSVSYDQLSDQKDANLTQVRNDSAFTVSDQSPVEIKAGDDLRAVLQPKSHAELHVDTKGQRYLSLQDGSGSFQLNAQARVDAGSAEVHGDGARLAATWSALPALPGNVADQSGRQLRLAVTEGKAKVQVAGEAHELTQNEAILLDVKSNKVTRTRRQFHGALREIVHRTVDTTVVVGDSRLQRSYSITPEVVLTIDGKPADVAQLSIGDVVDVTCTTDRPEKVLAVTMVKHLWMDAAH